MTNQQNNSKMLDRLDQLFQDAGYTIPELVTYIKQLEEQNNNLTTALQKATAASKRQSVVTNARHNMNSRLKDALRE